MMRIKRPSWMEMAPSPLAGMRASAGRFRRVGVESAAQLVDPRPSLRLVRGEVERDLVGLVGEEVQGGEDELGDYPRLDRRAEADHAAGGYLGHGLRRILAHLGVDAVELRQIDEVEDPVGGLPPFPVAAVDLRAFLPGAGAAQLEEDDVRRLEERGLFADVRFVRHGSSLAKKSISFAALGNRPSS